MANVLIIDDDATVCMMLSQLVKRLGHEAEFRTRLTEGFGEARKNNYDVVLLDVHLPDGNGLDMLAQIRQCPSNPEVIIITGHGDMDGAEIAIKSGAWDYIQKTDSVQKIMLPLRRVIQYRNEVKRHQTPTVALKLNGIVGNSSQMRACFDQIAHAASSDGSVLITGETGTGKEIFASALHKNSKRSKGNFVVVDCAVMPANLVEALLFGHQKGAFTGAYNSNEGLIKQADGGTLFLDEIGELPPALQKSFLRVLQERRFRPLGSNYEVASDFRLVAATNKNLDEMVTRDLFRKDLLFRLKTFAIQLPPLRDRNEDIKELVVSYIAKLCKQYGIETKGFSPEFIDTLEKYQWPGNVRELVNTLERAIGTAVGEPTLFPRHLPTNIRVEMAQKSVGKGGRLSKSAKEIHNISGTLPELRIFREEMDRRYFDRLIREAGGNIKAACRISGISRSRLYDYLNKFNMSSSS